MADGIRATGDGWLVITGLTGIILSIDLAGVALDGANDGDLNILREAPAGVDFDDLTPLAVPIPVPLLPAWGLALLVLASSTLRVQSYSRHSTQRERSLRISFGVLDAPRRSVCR
jgi:hypothetical protein